MAGGDATWLRSPLLPKPFVLELLDFILNASAELFRTLHDFESAVTGRVSYLNRYKHTNRSQAALMC